MPPIQESLQHPQSDFAARWRDHLRRKGLAEEAETRIVPGAIEGALSLVDMLRNSPMPWENPSRLQGALDTAALPAKALVGMGKGVAGDIKEAMDNPTPGNTLGLMADIFLGSSLASAPGLAANRIRRGAQDAANRGVLPAALLRTGKTREEIDIQGGPLSGNVGGKVGQILDDHGIEWEYHPNGGITAAEHYVDKFGRPGTSRKHFDQNASLRAVRDWLGY